MTDDKLGNYFDETHGLIMNAKPYLKRLVFGIPNRTVSNRIFYIREGEARIKINFINYDIKKGDFLLVPSNYILMVEEFSENVDPWMLDFHYQTNEEKELVGIETLFMHLTEDEERVIGYYFNLMNQLDSSSQNSGDELMHLVMSFLYRINRMNEVRSGKVKKERLPRVKQIKSEFINMVVTQDVPQLTIAEYAEALGVSENYLSIIIKQETNQTVKKWIEQKTETLIKLLLTEPKNRNLSEIAEIVGYSSPPQVVRFFKRRTGMTPNEYRKSKLEEKAYAME
ncbi:MAG: helix-turn-helix domain-containing protein [Bacteroidales bacterium]|nr:helix-turn-helix domain-containing protein [Bacteroidales bacterium]